MDRQSRENSRLSLRRPVVHNQLDRHVFCAPLDNWMPAAHTHTHHDRVKPALSSRSGIRLMEREAGAHPNRGIIKRISIGALRHSGSQTLGGLGAEGWRRRWLGRDSPICEERRCEGGRVPTEQGRAAKVSFRHPRPATGRTQAANVPHPAQLCRRHYAAASSTNLPYRDSPVQAMPQAIWQAGPRFALVSAAPNAPGHAGNKGGGARRQGNGDFFLSWA